MQQQGLPFHEAMEIHELLNLKTINTLKSKLIQGVVFDQELKRLLEQNVQLSIQATNNLQNLLMRFQTNRLEMKTCEQ